MVHTAVIKVKTCEQLNAAVREKTVCWKIALCLKGVRVYSKNDHGHFHANLYQLKSNVKLLGHLRWWALLVVTLQ